MSHLLVLAVHNEPATLILGHTVSKCIQKETLEFIVGVLCGNLVQEWFYARHISTSAKVGLWVLGCGGMTYCWRQFRYNFCLLHNFTNNSILSFLVLNKTFLKMRI
jgi:hypothetical protein